MGAGSDYYLLLMNLRECLALFSRVARNGDTSDSGTTFAAVAVDDAMVVVRIFWD